MEFTEEQIQRYSRQIILPDVGGKGQQKLREAKVLLVGAGGLGSPIALYLGAAGIGTIGLIDGDVVDLSNLQRQVLHTTPHVGVPKVESGRRLLSALNPDVTVNTYQENISADNIMKLIPEYDIVLDGSDNFGTRFLVNDACFFAKKTLISGSIFRFEGQLTTIKPHEGYPCYRCLYPEPPPAGLVPNCQEAGVLGVLAGRDDHFVPVDRDVDRVLDRRVLPGHVDGVGRVGEQTGVRVYERVVEETAATL